MIYVREIEKTQKGIREFLDLSYRLYRKDPNWVPPLYGTVMRSLLGENNPLLCGEHQFFMAYDGERPVARVLAGVDPRLNERLGEKRGYISLFETEKNMEYARAVLDAAMDYLLSLGMEKVAGPNTPGFNDFGKGLLQEGFDGKPVLFNPYNPPFYNDFFTAYGFTKHRDHYAYWLELSEFPVAETQRLSDMAQKRFGFRVESVDPHKADHTLLAKRISQVVTEAFPEHWELVPPTEKDIVDEMKGLLSFAESGLIVMAFAQERPVGVLVAFPDYNPLLKTNQGRLFPFGWLTMLLGRKSVRVARCVMLFVSPDYQRKAVSAALASAAYENARRLGYQAIEASTIDETNLPSILNTQRMGAKRYRVYRQYEKKLEPCPPQEQG